MKNGNCRKNSKTLNSCKYTCKVGLHGIGANPLKTFSKTDSAAGQKANSLKNRKKEN